MRALIGRAEDVKTTTDEDLVRLALGGETSAFGELSDRYRRPLFNAAFRILGFRAEAQDAAQDAIVKALTNLEQFDLDRRFFSWIYRIAVNEALDRLERDKLFVDESAEEMLNAASAAPRALELVEQGEHQERIHQAIQQLPPNDRALIVLHYLAEMPYTEVAETLDLSVEIVRSRLFSARGKLRKVLEA